MMQTEATANKATGISRRLFASKLFWLAIFLAALNVFFQSFDPLEIIGANSEAYQLVQGAVKQKSAAIRALKEAPDVVLIGSSLPMAAAYYADCKYYKPDVQNWIKHCETRKISAFQSYGQARYLENRLSSACGRPVSVFNLTSAACMPSDAYLLLSNAIENQPNVKTVIYGVAPRDFMDNLVPEVGLTPAFEVLAKPSILNATVTSDTPPPVAFELAMSSLCSFYRQRVNLRELVSSVPSRVLDREVTLAKVVQKYGHPGEIAAMPARNERPASAGILPAQTAKPDATSQLDGHYKDYNARYNPPNQRRFRQELDQFKKLLSLCRDHHIQLVVVNMPITRRNKEMIDRGLYDQFNTNISQLPGQFGATFINMDDSDYDPKVDYMDSVHLSDQGAPKLINRLVDKITPRIICAGTSEQRR
jgi:hypothetical protein